MINANNNQLNFNCEDSGPLTLNDISEISEMTEKTIKNHTICSDANCKSFCGNTSNENILVDFSEITDPDAKFDSFADDNSYQNQPCRQRWQSINEVTSCNTRFEFDPAMVLFENKEKETNVSAKWDDCELVSYNDSKMKLSDISTCEFDSLPDYAFDPREYEYNMAKSRWPELSYHSEDDNYDCAEEEIENPLTDTNLPVLHENCHFYCTHPSHNQYNYDCEIKQKEDDNDFHEEDEEVYEHEHDGREFNEEEYERCLYG